MDLILNLLKENFRTDLAIFLAAAVPFTELRAAIPLAVSLGIAPFYAFWLGVLGNLLPLPFLLIGLDPLVNFIRQTPLFGLDRFFDWLYRRTAKKSDKVDRYGALSLIFFVAIPLPTTGVWTAAVAASIFRIRFVPAFAAIALGVLMAGILVTLLSVGFF